MQIPVLGTLIIQSTINEERKQHILPVMLANGVLPEKIWLSKLFVSMIASYMFCLVSVIGGILYTKTVYNIWITINLYLAKMKIEMNWILLLLIGTSLAGGVFIVCFYIAKKINKEYIVNIDV